MAEEKKSFGDFLVGLGVIAADQLKRVSLETETGGEIRTGHRPPWICQGGTHPPMSC